MVEGVGGCSCNSGWVAPSKEHGWVPLYNPQIIHCSISLNLDSKSQSWADFIFSFRLYSNVADAVNHTGKLVSFDLRNWRHLQNGTVQNFTPFTEFFVGRTPECLENL